VSRSAVDRPQHGDLKVNVAWKIQEEVVLRYGTVTFLKVIFVPLNFQALNCQCSLGQFLFKPFHKKHTNITHDSEILVNNLFSRPLSLSSVSLLTAIVFIIKHFALLTPSLLPIINILFMDVPVVVAPMVFFKSLIDSHRSCNNLMFSSSFIKNGPPKKEN